MQLFQVCISVKSVFNLNFSQLTPFFSRYIFEIKHQEGFSKGEMLFIVSLEEAEVTFYQLCLAWKIFRLDELGMHA